MGNWCRAPSVLFDEEGWTELGRTKNFDWMHVQAAIPACDVSRHAGVTHAPLRYL